MSSIQLRHQDTQESRSQRRLRDPVTPTIFGQKVYKFLQSYADFNYYSLVFLTYSWDLDKLTNMLLQLHTHTHTHTHTLLQL